MTFFSSLAKPKVTSKKLRDRSAFLFMKPSPDTDKFATCGTCVNFLQDAGRCYWYSNDEKDEVDEDDTCGLYVQGTPQEGKSKKPSGLSTKEVAGFYDGSPQCRRCNAYDDRDKSRTHCDLYVQLNRMMPNIWKLEEDVGPHDCCNAWYKGERNPKNFGPYGPIPDADDSSKAGGFFSKLNKKG